MPSELRDKRTSDVGKAVVKEVKKEKMTGPMDRWVEPALATKASYEDHNGVPYGVNEHMQPLGEAPSSKVRARVKAEGARKSLVGRTAVTATATPEGTPQPPAHTQTRQQVKVEHTPAPVSSPTKHGDANKDVDYAPTTANGSKKKEPVKKPRVSKKAAQEARDLKKDLLSEQRCTEEKIVSVIVEAKTRANESGNPELADAVQEVYNDSLKNPRLHTVLVKVLTQTASPSDMDEFQTYVKAAKRRLAARKDAATPKASEETTTRKVGKPEVNGASTSSAPTTSTNKAITAATKVPPPRDTSQNPPMKTRPASKTREKATVPTTNSFSRKSATPGMAASSTTAAATTTMTARGQKRPQALTDSESTSSELTDFEEDDDIVVADGPGSNGRTATRTGATTKLAFDTAAPKVSDAPSAKASSKRVSAVGDGAVPDPNPKERAAARKSREASRASLAVPQNNLKRSSEEAELDKGATPDPEFQAKKQKLSNKVQRDSEFAESNVRTVRQPPTRKTRDSSRISGINGSARQTRQANKDLALDDYSDLGSPLSSPTVSHRFTPPPVTLKARSGKRAKTKQSPEKKQTHASGPLSGMGGATGLNSPMDVDDSDAEASENDDYCSACAGSGHLLCCDGCERSFHFTCLDPPLAEDSEELNEPWFCYQCVAKKRSIGEAQAEKQRFGLFAPLLANLSKRNPTIFALPPEIKNYYEGVGADNDGNFTNVPRPGKKKSGFGDPVDLFKLRDAKGNILFCYHCQETSHGSRQVVQCDECSTLWHLDCLDPPLTIHPCITGDGRKVADWLCPLHIDHELRQVEARRLFHQQQGRKLHVRKPRGAKVVETFLTRGAANNGLIEVNYVDSSDDESESEFYLEDDPRRDDVVLKVPDSGIKLDFIAKVKQDRVQQYRDFQFDRQVFGKAQGSRVQMVNTRRLPSIETTSLAQRSLREQQTALNLAQFAHADTNDDLGLGRNDVETLIAGLVAEAPAKVTESTSPQENVPGTVEKDELLALQALIARRLAELRA